MSRQAIPDERTPPSFHCPITQEMMTNPVICQDGHTYEHAAISRWFEHHDTSPLTNVRLESKKLISNRTLKKAIEEFFALQQLTTVKTTEQTAPTPKNNNAALVAQEGDYPIHCAIRQKNITILNQLVEPENLFLKNKKGETAVELAYSLGYLDLVKVIVQGYCLNTNSPTDIKNAYRKIALDLIRKKEVGDVFFVLYTARAISSREYDYETGNFLIHFAIEQRNIILLDKILSAACLSLRNKSKKTPLELAADLGYWDLVIRFATHYPFSACTEQTTRDGYNTVLLRAVTLGKTDVFQALLKAGASTTMLCVKAANDPIRTNNVTSLPTQQVRSKPTVDQLKQSYLLKAGFFNASSKIFTGNNVDQIIRTLKKRADSKAGKASDLTLRAFGLR